MFGAMSVIPGAGVFSLINGFVDRAIGADGLSPHVRQKLLRQQLRSVGQMTPAMLVASVVVSTIFLMLTWGTARFVPVAVATTAINLLQIHGTVLALLVPPAPHAGKPTRPVVRTILYAFLIGTLWGL